MLMLKKMKMIFGLGKSIIRDNEFINAKIKSQEELLKTPNRTTLINSLLKLTNAQNYLEIGVRNPDTNFNKIECKNKFSVDPGVEHIENPVDFKMTSDEFFEAINSNHLKNINNTIKFDVIFIDGLHTSYQAEKDIENSLHYIKDDGFIVLHDCNPPTEYHQRENYNFKNSPASLFWNGTTWKAFYKYRHRTDLYSMCLDSDWGLGIISKYKYPLFSNILNEINNSYFEFNDFDLNRKEYLNLVEYDYWITKF